MNTPGNNKHLMTEPNRSLLREINEVVYSRMHTLLKAFHEFDADGNKSISIDEFVRLLRKNKVNISHEEAWQLFRLVSDNGDALTYGGFVKLLAKGNN